MPGLADARSDGSGEIGSSRGWHVTYRCVLARSAATGGAVDGLDAGILRHAAGDPADGEGDERDIIDDAEQRQEIGQEFGFLSRVMTRALGPVLLWSTKREQRDSWDQALPGTCKSRSIRRRERSRSETTERG